MIRTIHVLLWIPAALSVFILDRSEAGKVAGLGWDKQEWTPSQLPRPSNSQSWPKESNEEKDAVDTSLTLGLAHQTSSTGPSLSLTLRQPGSRPEIKEPWTFSSNDYSGGHEIMDEGDLESLDWEKKRKIGTQEAIGVTGNSGHQARTADIHSGLPLRSDFLESSLKLSLGLNPSPTLASGPSLRLSLHPPGSIPDLNERPQFHSEPPQSAEEDDYEQAVNVKQASAQASKQKSTPLKPTDAVPSANPGHQGRTAIHSELPFILESMDNTDSTLNPGLNPRPTSALGPSPPLAPHQPGSTPQIHEPELLKQSDDFRAKMNEGEMENDDRAKKRKFSTSKDIEGDITGNSGAPRTEPPTLESSLRAGKNDANRSKKKKMARPEMQEASVSKVKEIGGDIAGNAGGPIASRAESPAPDSRRLAEKNDANRSKIQKMAGPVILKSGEDSTIEDIFRKIAGYTYTPHPRSYHELWAFRPKQPLEHQAGQTSARSKPTADSSPKSLETSSIKSTKETVPMSTTGVADRSKADETRQIRSSMFAFNHDVAYLNKRCKWFEPNMENPPQRVKYGSIYLAHELMGIRIMQNLKTGVDAEKISAGMLIWRLGRYKINVEAHSYKSIVTYIELANMISVPPLYETAQQLQEAQIAAIEYLQKIWAERHRPSASNKVLSQAESQKLAVMVNVDFGVVNSNAISNALFLFWMKRKFPQYYKHLRKWSDHLQWEPWFITAMQNKLLALDWTHRFTTNPSEEAAALRRLKTSQFLLQKEIEPFEIHWDK